MGAGVLYRFLGHLAGEGRERRGLGRMGMYCRCAQVHRAPTWRCVEGWFGDGLRYALPGNVPQRAVWAEVR